MTVTDDARRILERAHNDKTLSESQRIKLFQSVLELTQTYYVSHFGLMFHRARAYDGLGATASASKLYKEAKWRATQKCKGLMPNPRDPARPCEQLPTNPENDEVRFIADESERRLQALDGKSANVTLPIPEEIEKTGVRLKACHKLLNASDCRPVVNRALNDIDPGDYELHVEAGEFDLEQTAFHADSGNTTTWGVRMKPKVRHSLEFEAGVGLDLWLMPLHARPQYTIDDPASVTVVDSTGAPTKACRTARCQYAGVDYPWGAFTPSFRMGVVWTYKGDFTHVAGVLAFRADPWPTGDEDRGLFGGELGLRLSLFEHRFSLELSGLAGGAKHSFVAAEQSLLTTRDFQVFTMHTPGALTTRWQGALGGGVNLGLHVPNSRASVFIGLQWIHFLQDGKDGGGTMLVIPLTFRYSFARWQWSKEWKPQ